MISVQKNAIRGFYTFIPLLPDITLFIPYIPRFAILLRFRFGIVRATPVRQFARDQKGASKNGQVLSFDIKNLSPPSKTLCGTFSNRKVVLMTYLYVLWEQKLKCFPS